jgi:hypothetical protein
MGFRFRRSVQLIPGVRLNLGKRGASLSIGGRGASLNVGKRGIYGNVGIPGTGLSYRERLDLPRRSAATQIASNLSSKPRQIDAILRLEDNGKFVLLDNDHRPLSDELREKALQQNSKAVIELLEQSLEKIEAEQKQMLRPDLQTPRPAKPDDMYLSEPFFEPKPQQPRKASPSLLDKVFKRDEDLEREYQKALAEYRVKVAHWRAAKANHEAKQESARHHYQRILQGDLAASESQFEERLSRIAWPRMTSVDFQLDGTTLHADIDLPEIEDMPRNTFKIKKRDYCLEKTEKGTVTNRKDYMTHVHAIGFRVAGEAFGALPALQEAIISGYSQRLSKSTGHLEDEYLFSVKIKRDDWYKINFQNLDSIDPVQALELFELRRNMTTTGIFKPIDPFA